MRPVAPNLLWITNGAAEGDTKLNAFDNALIAAGVGHWNLVKVTSVAPKGVQFVASPIEIEAGAVVPAVLASTHSDRSGERITSCIGIGLSSDSHGMIMEHSGTNDPEEIETLVRRMVQESFSRRSLELESVTVRSVSHRVERIGSTVVAAVLWWG